MGIVLKKKNKPKTALLRFKFSNAVTKALKAHCVKRRLSAFSFEEPVGTFVPFPSQPSSLCGATERSVKKPQPAQLMCHERYSCDWLIILTLTLIWCCSERTLRVIRHKDKKVEKQINKKMRFSYFF